MLWYSPEFFAISSLFIVKGNLTFINLNGPVKETSVKRVFVFATGIILLLHVIANGAGRAGEFRATWQVEWEKTLKAVEAEGEALRV